MNKEIYFKGLRKEERRRLAVISLLIKEELPQKYVPKKIEKVIDEEIDDQKLNNALKPLRKMEIIKNKPFTDKNNRLNNLLIIPKNYSTLRQLINYLYSKDDVPFLLDLKKQFIHSEYAKEVINLDLVLIIESKLECMLQERYNEIKFAFNEEERHLILKILQNSPSALHYAINSYNEDLNKILNYKICFLEKLVDTSPFAKEPENAEKLRNEFAKELKNELKKRFISNLQIYLSEDISTIGSPEPIEHTISIKFLQKELDEENYIYISNTHSSQVIEKDIVKNTIKTHSIVKNKNSITKDIFKLLKTENNTGNVEKLMSERKR